MAIRENDWGQLTLCGLSCTSLITIWIIFYWTFVSKKKESSPIQFTSLMSFWIIGLNLKSGLTPFPSTFLLYMCMCVLVAQLCPIAWDPVSPPDSSVHGIPKQEFWSCHSLLQMIFPTQRLNWCLMHYRKILYRLSHQGNPIS